MSSKVTINQSRGVRVVGLITIIAGVVLIVAGALAYYHPRKDLCPAPEGRRGCESHARDASR